MQVNPSQQHVKQDIPSQPIREGETARAQITSRISDREAMVMIRGQEVKATFEGRVPDRSVIHVEVQGKTDDGIRVKEVTRQTGQDRQAGVPTAQDARSVLRDLGIKEPSREMLAHTDKLMQRGVTLTRDTARELLSYVNSEKGTERERAQTITMLAHKRLEPTASQIRSVHEALHHSSYKSQITQAQGRETPSREQVEREIRNIQDRVTMGRPVTKEVQAVKERIQTLPVQADRQEMSRVLSKVEEAVNRQVESQPATSNRSSEAVASRQVLTTKEQTAEAVRQVIAAMQSGTNVRAAIEQLQATVQSDEALSKEVNQALRSMLTLQAKQGKEVAVASMRDLLVSLSPMPTKETMQTMTELLTKEPNIKEAIRAVSEQMTSMPREIAQKWDDAVRAATTKLDAGRELGARQILTDSLQQLSQTLLDPAQARMAELEQFVKNDVLSPLSLQSKQLLITEVTERLALATDQFKAFQRDVVNQLQRVEQLVAQFKQQALPQAKPMLENVIKQLDRAITKSDWLLHANMKQERQLLGASAKLNEAHKLLSRGNMAEATAIVKEVKRTLQEIRFQPTKERVQHVVQNMETKANVHRPSQQLDYVARTLTYNDHSPRQVLDGIRGLGLNRESELAQQLVNGKPITESQQRDLKSLLMKLGGDEEGKAQQTMQNLTGQQLLSKQETTPSQQMHVFHLPMQLKGELEDLQVFVNSRNNGEEVDWENCQLYFHIETKGLGPLGIALHVADRNLQVTLKNDTEGFGAKVEPLTEKYLEQLKEVGYNVSGVTTKALTEAQQSEQVEANERLAPIMTEKGFDYKI
ncbi:hypothetical protein FLK61_30195 [Paenalkalicoccus suaedae]|uniref:Flagellar hook-length control protein FliK n=1 Tax=Paenalkalicoccus suaedae TaxID=2592382 RepID=A0A859FE50_9BACI|nr:hypothetical protein [Paenalkalicoccus suaedae]QKS70992.1 hypothetical protein FLK61_30195 [Paenalkalicoccus suaedae]